MKFRSALSIIPVEWYNCQVAFCQSVDGPGSLTTCFPWETQFYTSIRMSERRTSRSILEFMTDCKRYHLDFLYDLASSSRRTAFRLDRISTHDKMENLTKPRPLLMMGAIVLRVRSIVPRKSIIRPSISRTRELSRSSRKTKGRRCIIARRSRPAARWSLVRQGILSTAWSCVVLPCYHRT